MTPKIHEWVEAARRDLSEEFGAKPQIAVLATADESGDPRARAVVCRGIGTDGIAWFVSDARSEKSRQLRSRPRAEAAFWLPELRRQYRMLGNVRIVSQDSQSGQRREAWEGLSDASRALFFWETPGEARRPETAFPEKSDTGEGPPPSFEVLFLSPERVERLDLTTHPHARRRWSKDEGWLGVDINP